MTRLRLNPGLPGIYIYLYNIYIYMLILIPYIYTDLNTLNTVPIKRMLDIWRGG